MKKWVLVLTIFFGENVMRKWTLMFGLVLSFNANAANDCGAGEENCWDCGKTANDLCTARRNGSELQITGTGEMKDYAIVQYLETTVPWGYDYTSVSVTGVKNIGEFAFVYSTVESASISDSVTSIGANAMNSCYNLQNVNIPDSVTSIGERAFAWSPFYGTIISDFVIPESVTSIGKEAFMAAAITSLVIDGSPNIENDAFTGIGFYATRPWTEIQAQVTIYCQTNVDCTNKGQNEEAVNIINYTKDMNGVYRVGESFYSSPETMSAGGTEEGCETLEACQNKAIAYKNAKALSMAGGSLCKTQSDCLDLINMANQKLVCNNIAACKAYGYEHGIGFGYPYTTKNADGSTTYYDADGTFLGYKNKRIYTIDEANAIAGNKNRVSIKYR
ncbi:MAG: leucine-rich repeat domain-containing protein [Alphaproteobacteria bacterium]|nr:leucine-rich repeat domain-containing protein [Alphaproteobacteria bacterium]